MIGTKTAAETSRRPTEPHDPPSSAEVSGHPTRAVPSRGFGGPFPTYPTPARPDCPRARTKTGTRSHPLLRDELNNRALTARLIGRLGLDLEPVRSPGRPGGPGFA